MPWPISLIDRPTGGGGQSIGGLPPNALEIDCHAAVGGCVSTLRTLRGVERVFDIKTLFGGLGVYSLKEQRA